MAAERPFYKAFVKLGTYLRQSCDFDNSEAKTPEQERLLEVLVKAEQLNGWFTQANLLHALGHWGSLLTEAGLREWLEPYDLKTPQQPKRVALIMAGNIPLVGFHDLCCVLLSGHNAMVKMASNDTALIPFLMEQLVAFDDRLAGRVVFVTERMVDFDAAIATGSSNTGRYFEHYFGKYPNIIRKNRNSVAVLDGTETEEELSGLGEDIFRYFGLGCRSVSKLYVPKDYGFEPFFKAVFNYQDIMEHAKYANNYDYNKAVFLMSEYKLRDNGFLLLKADDGFGSPIGTLFYEHYVSVADLEERLEASADALQCVVGRTLPDSIAFGHTQVPELDAYADGIDTLDFLKRL
ncbi:acyl-CoA reductase [Flagellimonas sp. DF-77]|uniref:acyl-CoA reductase n=1 Tax=Flagellimonas algarum TaxID=3230298 RepID=UPI0033961D6E